VLETAVTSRAEVVHRVAVISVSLALIHSRRQLGGQFSGSVNSGTGLSTGDGEYGVNSVLKQEVVR